MDVNKKTAAYWENKEELLAKSFADIEMLTEMQRQSVTDMTAAVSRALEQIHSTYDIYLKQEERMKNLWWSMYNSSVSSPNTVSKKEDNKDG